MRRIGNAPGANSPVRRSISCRQRLLEHYGSPRHPLRWIFCRADRSPVSCSGRHLRCVRLSNSLMRPPVETPSMNKPRLRISKVPVKQVDTRRISSLSSGLVPFKSVPPVMNGFVWLVLRLCQKVFYLENVERIRIFCVNFGEIYVSCSLSRQYLDLALSL